MRIAAYCRVSTEKDEQLDSMHNQKYFFQDFALKYNHELVQIYADEGISGKQMENRVQFLRMLADSKNDIFDMVVVKDISRFARNTVDFLTAVRELKGIGIEVQFLSNNQTILGNSEFILTIFSAMAQEESANLSKRVKFGKKVNAKKGRVPNIIYGYDKIDTFTLAINENEANIVKRIFYMYSKEGYGTRRISIALNSEKIPSKKGTNWSAKTIRRMLTNPIYIGILINNKVETIDFLTGKRRVLPEDENFIHKKPELKIISEEQYNTVQNQLVQRQRVYENGRPGGRYSNRHIFSTLIKCANCGYSFSRKIYQYKNTYIRWRCSGNSLYTKEFCQNNFSINEKDLLDQIKEYFLSNITNKRDFVQNIFDDYHQKCMATHLVFDQKVLDKQSEKLKRLKEKYKNMYSNDIIKIDELKYKCLEIDAKILAINKNISKNKQFSFDENQRDHIIADIENLLTFEEFTNADMRKLVEKIVVHQNSEIYIYLKTI